ncbi:MAG: glycosyl transferase, group 1 family protein, partial [Rhodocyclales bacterium]|nr:glycosyl transferase, group 1 family protein [Rhodocyclales bacterium]
RFPGAVVAVSEGVRGELAKALRLSSARLRHIPNPLVTSTRAMDADATALAEEMPRGYLLAVGRLDRHTKGFDILIAAYAALPAPRPGLVIVGDGPDRSAIEVDIARAGVDGEVALTGWVRDPRPFYRRASAFVLASRYEGWSNVLMEAMGEGCLVVATCCPYGPAEILGPDLVGWLVPPEDVASLTHSMQYALSRSDAERDAVSASLRARVQRFAADKVALQWTELAMSIAHGKAQS